MTEVNAEMGNSPKSELEILKEALAAEQVKNAVLEEKNARIEEEKALKDKIDSEKRFTSARNTLVLRTITNREEIIPARTVFDYLEILDKKHLVEKKDRTYISNAELKAYQDLKAEGNADVSYEMVKERVSVKKPAADDAAADDAAADAGKTEVAEPEVAETAES